MSVGSFPMPIPIRSKGGIDCCKRSPTTEVTSKGGVLTREFLSSSDAGVEFDRYVATGYCDCSSTSAATVLECVYRSFLQNVIVDFPALKVPDKYIGAVSSATSSGMMVGAVGLGTCPSTIARSISSH